MGPEPKPRAVHQLRTTIRRFETLLPAADETSPGAERRLRKQLDRLRKRAGKVRDADVHLQALATLARGSAGEAYERVREALKKEREKRQKRLARALAAERERGLLKRLRQVVGHAAVHPSAGAEDGERILALVRERFARALEAATPLGAENLHAFRIQTKRLRYLAESAGPGAATTVAQLKRVQDAAGAWHDWLTLCQRAEQVLAEAPTPLLAAMRARTAGKLETAVTVVARVGRRLQGLRVPSPRKGARPVAGERTPAALRSAGASA
jgi:CHAD domain-containing protein